MSPSVYFRRFERDIFLIFEKEDHVKKFLKYINDHHQNIRNSCPEVFCEKGVLRNFAKFTGKHQCQNLFFNKVASLRPPTLFKKRLWHRCFTVNFQKFLRTPYLQNTSGWLLLYIVYFELFLLLWSSPLYFSIQGTFAVYQDGLGWRPNIGFLLAKVFAGLWPVLLRQI